MKEMRRKPEVPEARVPVVECLDGPARITSKELAPIHSVKSGILQYALLYKSENGCRFGEKCSYAHRQVEEQPSKRSKKNGDKSAVAMLKKHEQHKRTVRPVVYDHSSNTQQLGLRTSRYGVAEVFIDFAEVLRHTAIRCVKFTRAVVRHADIRDQNPSLGMICPGDPHQRNTNAPKFEDRSQEETEWQEQGARQAAWRLAKSVLKFKEKNKAAFFSPSENRCLPASILKPEGKRICCRLWSVDAHDQQKGLE